MNFYNMDIDDFISGVDLSDVTLVVTSPPYFNYRSYGNNKVFASPRDWGDWCIDIINKLANSIKSDGVIWWNTAGGYKDKHKLPEVYRMVSILDDIGVKLVDEIPWVKTSSPPKKFSNRPYMSWEHNFLFSIDPGNVKFYVDNVRRPYAESTKSRVNYDMSVLRGTEDGEFIGTRRIKLNPLGASPPNYLLLPQDTTKRNHPATMLPELANWAIRAYSDNGDIVLDPMCGCGTTLVEATKLGREFIGNDLNADYLDMAVVAVDKVLAGENPY